MSPDLKELIKAYPFLKGLNEKQAFNLEKQLELFLDQSRIWLVDFKKNFPDTTLVVDEIKRFISQENSTHQLLIEHNDGYNDFILALETNEINHILHYLQQAIAYIDNDMIFAVENYQEERGYC